MYLGSTDCHVQFRTDVHTEDLEEKEEEEEERRRRRRRKGGEEEKGDGTEGGSMWHVPHETRGGGGVWLTTLRTSLSCPYKVCRGCSNNSCRGGHKISCEQGLTPSSQVLLTLLLNFQMTQVVSREPVMR